MKKVVYYCLILIFSVTFLISAYSLADYYLETLEAESQYGSLADIVDAAKDPTGTHPTIYINPWQPAPEITEPSIDTTPTEPSNDTTPTETVPVETLPDETQPTEPEEEGSMILPEYSELYLRNDEIVGWISIEGSVINYPVMQSPNSPDYYLDHNFEKQPSSHGCIYADEKCNVWEPSDNVILYGHNMRNGSMFAALARYTNRQYMQAHPYIQFDTLLEHHTYQIFAVFRTSAIVGRGFDYNDFIDAESEEEFNEFIRQIKAIDIWETGITAEYGDKLLLLSTCEYTLEEGRLVVVAKRIDTAE